MIVKPNKVVVKMYRPDGTFWEAVNIPSVKFPLNRSAYELFTSENTQRITDEKILEIFDQQHYKIGHCYSNSQKLAADLREAGYDAKTYCGWLFVTSRLYPLHHCWVVLDGNVLDLADDYTAMLSGQNGKNFDDAAGNPDLVRELIASFHMEARNHPHRIRCQPVGKPTVDMIYVGCECDPEEGRNIFNNLIRRYPNHECQRCVKGTNLSPTQAVLAKYGLMD